VEPATETDDPTMPSPHLRLVTTPPAREPKLSPRDSLDRATIENCLRLGIEETLSPRLRELADRLFPPPPKLRVIEGRRKPALELLD
jgi:hypothetical protein